MGHSIGLLQKMYHIIRIYLSIYIRAKNRADSVKVEGRNQNQQMLIEKKKLSIHAKVVESNNNNISTFPTDYEPKVTSHIHYPKAKN